MTIVGASGRVILVSACLLGLYCRYDGRRVVDERLGALAAQYTLVPVCPEQLGGLPTPRESVELVSGRAMTQSGMDVTSQFVDGAQDVVRIARLTGARTAILQPRSPSCGCRQIYDGSFSGTLVSGQGILADMLRRHGLTLFEPGDLDELNV